MERDPAEIAEAMRQAMARVATGVAVVSAAWEGGFRGLTATSFTSVSLTPPIILVCMETAATTREAVVVSGRFAVSVLARDQEFYAERFSGQAPAVDPIWQEVPHRLGGDGLPIIVGCASWLECRVSEVHPAGDHDVVVGLVEAAGVSDAEPLVRWDRAYWRLG